MIDVLVHSCLPKLYSAKRPSSWQLDENMPPFHRNLVSETVTLLLSLAEFGEQFISRRASNLARRMLPSKPRFDGGDNIVANIAPINVRDSLGLHSPVAHHVHIMLFNAFR